MIPALVSLARRIGADGVAIVAALALTISVLLIESLLRCLEERKP